MKKIIITCFSLVLLCSCKKDRTCSCTVTETVSNPSGSHTDVSVYDITIVKARKRPAKHYCAHLKITDPNNNNVTVITDRDCQLR